MKITAITTCVGFADYLRISMPWNGPILDSLDTGREGIEPGWLIVTSKKPEHEDPIIALTPDISADWDIFTTDAFYRDGAPFNKGAAINDALNYIGQWGLPIEWILLLDADVLLPPDFGETIRAADLNKDHIYGMYREECDDVQRFLGGDRSGLVKQHGQARRSIGLGMFTLFHWDAQTMRERRAAGGPLYPEEHPTAQRSDRFHLKCWRPEHRGPNARGSAVAFPLDPDVFGRLVHFGPDPVRSKANHEGRTTERIDGAGREARLGSQGVLYLLNWGNSFLTRLAVSLYSLRQHYDGPATVLGSTGGEVDFSLLEQICSDFDADLLKFETPGKGRVNSLPIKARLHQLTPYDHTLYLDADTVVCADLSEYFELIEEHGLIAVQQADWCCGGRKIAGRLRPYIEAGILDKPPDDFPAINTGVFGFERGHEVFKTWHSVVIEAIEKKSKDHCLDESVLNILMGLHGYGHVLPSRYNASGTKHPDKTFADALIIHFHGGKHVRKDWLCPDKPPGYHELEKRPKRRALAAMPIPADAWGNLSRSSQIWCETFDALVAKYPHYLGTESDKESRIYVECRDKIGRGASSLIPSRANEPTALPPVTTSPTSCPIPKTRLSPSDEEMVWLEEFTRQYNPVKILEFGCGVTTWAMQRGRDQSDSNRLLCVEAAPNAEDWQALYDKTVEVCDPEIQDHWDFGDRKFDFVLVDSSAGWTGRDGLHRDKALQSCEDNLSPGAIVVAHDSRKRSGRAVVAYCDASPDYTHLTDFKGRTGFRAWRYERKADSTDLGAPWLDYSDITLVMVASNHDYLEKAKLTLRSFDRQKKWSVNDGASILVLTNDFKDDGPITHSFGKCMRLETNGATSRERSLAAHFFAAEHVETPWMLKLDAAEYCTDSQSFLFEGMREFDLIGRPGGYTKGAQMVPMIDFWIHGCLNAGKLDPDVVATLQLDAGCKKERSKKEGGGPRFLNHLLELRAVDLNDWRQIEPLLKPAPQTFVMNQAGEWRVHPFLGMLRDYIFHNKGDSPDPWKMRFRQPRINSPVRLAKTALLREIADLCPHGRLPAPSEDTLLWRFCERLQRPWKRFDFWNCGISHSKRIVKMAKSNPEWF